tara:strand:+ start:800 stop:1474 length:675 start_codon:yes stop_codon:yes gene_type:complete
MSINFFNRVLTSVILSLILFICLFINKFLWAYLLIVVSIISFKEIKNLFKRIYKNKKKILLLNLVSFLYLLFFTYVGYYIYETSIFIMIFILLICFFSDTGGYVIGKVVGGKKLTKISPNKTISGSVGSFIFSLFPSLVVLYFSEQSNLFLSTTKSFWQIILVSLFLSFICQAGDLFISFLKRRAKIKDTGSILPGHGGLLDRIDGLIFVLPAAYILGKIFLIL